MATLATILDRFIAAKSLDQAAPRTRVLEQEDLFEVPAFPNEDVYFYIKRINNAHVLREADPAAAMVRVLSGGNRRFAGATAPAAGLYLWRVEYPPIYGIPAPDHAQLLPPAD